MFDFMGYVSDTLRCPGGSSDGSSNFLLDLRRRNVRAIQVGQPRASSAGHQKAHWRASAALNAVNC